MSKTDIDPKYFIIIYTIILRPRHGGKTHENCVNRKSFCLTFFLRGKNFLLSIKRNERNIYNKYDTFLMSVINKLIEFC